MNMDLRNGLICLSIVAMLMLCVPNVAAASTSKLATGAHNGHATNAPSTQLVVTIINQNGRMINTTTVNHPVFICGNLAQKGLSIPIWIGNAYVDIQVQNDDGTWTTILTATTGTGLNNGNLNVRWTPDDTGVFNLRAYFDGGNGQYAPCVSNVVTLTVNEAATS